MSYNQRLTASQAQLSFEKLLFSAMYNEYFGFHENPFSIAPDPRYLYLSEMHQDGLAHLKYGLSSEGCIILLTGEVGTGKTTLCRFFLEQLEPTANVALIINPCISAFELLAAVCDEFMVKVNDDAFTTKQYLDALDKFLLDAHADNNPALLVIDEAQNLDKGALEMIRLLTNLETNRQKLLRIFLLGQSELSTLLLSPDLTQVNQRITGRFQLTGMQDNETGDYITHRLKVAGGDAAQLFSSRAVKRIHQLTSGVPRLINSLCDRSLISAYADSQERVDEPIVKKAAREVFGFDHASKTIEVPVNSLVAGVLTVLAIVLVWVGTTSDIFHLNLSSILPPPQKSATAPTVTTKQGLFKKEVIQENGERVEKEAEEVVDVQPEETLLIDIQSRDTADEEIEVTPTLSGVEQSVVKTDETPRQNNIFIAPVEFSERREQEPTTRIMINAIEINE
ncbi:MAG: AAA family ATPase [Desulfofustis sp.]|nr:AAA family ATPase [Desulfofustis sp.]